ncbi:polysaccharide deacetylase family protein [Anaeroselena agilis]|uniref:Polysaccharide deacetylase family protein n=1 Tax=Anaeroselena agilis TaxID=3063788 RepID=A0ABU3NY55_9FIRM|nr:polysaccharide deacetylase family protein [Selenomonadales bacterium 4137-cl]
MKRKKTWGFILAVGVFAALLAGGHALQDHSRAIKKVPTNHKIIALTFDDGPHPHTTRALLAVLRDKKARATFFLLGENAAKYPDLLAEIAAAGQEIANHGYHHKFPNKQPRAELYDDLARFEKVVAAVGVRPVLFRPPGGGYNDPLVNDLAARGYTTILWSIDTRDWERRSPAQVAATVISGASPGSIVLLHEGECAITTPAAVAVIIDRLRTAGYEFVTVGELLQYYEIRQ